MKLFEANVLKDISFSIHIKILNNILKFYIRLSFLV